MTACSLQKLNHLADINLESHMISADLTCTEKYSRHLRVFINVITFGLYGYYLENQMITVAKTIADIIANKESLLANGAKEADISNLTLLSMKLEDKLNGSRHLKAGQILAQVLHPNKPLQVTKNEREQVLKACYQFASTLRAAFASKNINETFCFSTPSILLALSMTLKGLTADDKFALVKTLGLVSMSEERIHATVGGLTDLLSVKTSDATCTVSNAVLTLKGFSPEFVSTVKQQYNGEIIVGSNGMEIGDKANFYVKEKTQGMIEEVVEPSPDLSSVILNALYFKGEWIEAFKEKKTKMEEFTSLDGTKTNAAMLHSNDNIAYFEAENYKMIEKEYKSPEGKKLSFLAYLPNDDKNIDIEELEKSLSMEMVQYSRAKAYIQEVDLMLPKFDIEGSFPDMKEVLESLGMSFKGGVESQPIDQIIHKTRVKLDEKGTEAAAVTAVLAKECMVYPETFHANKPFTYLIMLNDQVLFQGSIRNQKGLEIS